MLNEAPKKKKDYSNPTKVQLSFRTIGECLRRAVTPYLMYLFMSLIMLACQAISNKPVAIVLGILCIGGGAFFNGHLCFHYGILHYGAYVAGNLHRRNAVFGIQSGGDHHREREYSPWKGFLIGLFVGLPVLVFGIIAGSVPGSLNAMGFAYFAFAMFAGYAIIPITWFGQNESGFGLKVSPYWSLLFILLSVLVSGIFYIVGAKYEERRRAQEDERMNQVQEAGEKARKGKK